MSAPQPLDLKQLSGRLRAASAAAGDTDRRGDLVMKAGRIARPEWNLRKNPEPGEAASRRLRLNDVVFVERSLGQADWKRLGWLYVYATPGNGGEVVEGWVRSDGVFLDPPEPEAKIEYIAARAKLIDIAAHHYKPPKEKDGKGGFKWGDDARFYVAALAYVNKNYGAMIWPDGWTDADFKDRGRWKDIDIKAGHGIWVPRREYLQPVKGRFVNSGSLTYEAWQAIRGFAGQVWEIVVGTPAFTAGLVHGALLSVYDALADVVELVQLVWKVLKSLLTLEIVKDARKLWNDLKGIDWRQAMGAVADDFMAKWEAEGTWERSYFQGKVVGYIMGMAALAFLTAGATAAASAAGKASKLAKAVKMIANNPVARRVIDHPSVKRVADKTKDALGKSKEVQEKLAAAGKTAARGVREGDLVSLPRARGMSRKLSPAEMETLMRDTLSRRPYLARLRLAQRLDGPALEKELMDIVGAWKDGTGKLHLKVTDGTVKRMGSQGSGGWAVDSLSGKEVMILEEQVFKNPRKLLDEVTHELVYDAVRDGRRGVPALGNDLPGFNFAHDLLERLIKDGDRTWGILRGMGKR